MKLRNLLFIVLAAIVFCNCQSYQPTSLTVASYNLRNANGSDSARGDGWGQRYPVIAQIVQYHDFDIFGTQECFLHQLKDMKEALPGYDYIGVGRDDGKDKGEHSAIFYKTGRFDLLDKGNFWFSETPDVPGKGWDATCCNRICSWGKFRDKESGKVFYFFNSHYDHQGKVARRESSKLLIARIKQIAGTDATVFATGDFNAVPTDEPMVTLASDGLLLDSYDLSEQPRYGTEGTYNSFKTDSEMMNRIDYIWVTKGTKVKKYAVLNDMQYGRFPSDHFPVMIQVAF